MLDPRSRLGLNPPLYDSVNGQEFISSAWWCRCSALDAFNGEHRRI